MIKNNQLTYTESRNSKTVVTFCVDSPLRSMTKALMWRMLASMITFIISYIVTSKIDVSGIIMAADMIVKIVVYYVHERMWSKISFGLNKSSA